MMEALDHTSHAFYDENDNAMCRVTFYHTRGGLGVTTYMVMIDTIDQHLQNFPNITPDEFGDYLRKTIAKFSSAIRCAAVSGLMYDLGHYQVDL